MGTYGHTLVRVAILALLFGLAFPIVVSAATEVSDWTYRTEAQCVQVRSRQSLNYTRASARSTTENWHQIDCESGRKQPVGEIRARDNLWVFNQNTGSWDACFLWSQWWTNPSETDYYATWTNWNYRCGRNRTYGCSCGAQVFDNAADNAAWRDINRVWLWSGSEVWK